MIAGGLLAALMAVPTSAAPPTYSGPIVCTIEGTGTGTASDSVFGVTKKVLNTFKKDFVATNNCAKGTVDDSGIQKDA